MAKELGKTVKELLSQMDSKEYTEWQCYFTVLQEKTEEEKKDMEEKQKDTLKSDIATSMVKAKAYRKAKK